MENKNNKLEYHTGYFSGKEFQKKGTTKDGREWKMYKLNLKFTQDAPFGTKFTVFSGCKGWELLDELEGEPMVVGFERGTYVHPQYGTIETRTVAFIGEGKVENIKKYESSVKKKEATEVKEMTEEEMDKKLASFGEDKEITFEEVLTEPTSDEMAIAKAVVSGNGGLNDLMTTLSDYKQQGKDVLDVTEARAKMMYNRVKSN